MADEIDVAAWAQAAIDTYHYNDVTTDELLETYMPALIAEVKRLRERVAELEHELEHPWANGT